MKEEIIYKQMMPLPDDVTALLETENGEYKDLENDGWISLCLVLYEVHRGNELLYSGIGIYAVDSSGYGELEEDYRLVRKKK